jgi:hypothetical protein
MATEPKGYFFPDVVNDFLEEKGAKYDSPAVDYWYSPQTAGSQKGQTITAYEGGNAGKQSLRTLGEYVCMDVGCWTGDGEKSEKNHQRHRDFGVVCGNMAVLCSFPGKTGNDKKKAASNPKKKIDITKLEDQFYKQRIKPFLDYLSSGKLPRAEQGSGAGKPFTPTHGLIGDVQVEGVLSTGKPPDDQTIHVFLGDLHLPVISDKKNTYVPSLPGSGDRVPRAGRLDLGEQAKAKLRDALLSAPKGGVSAYAWAAGGAVALTCAEEARVIGYMLANEVLAGWDRQKTDGWMGRKEAEEWADYYVGKNGNKGAEIFQGAAAELLSFLELLEHWKGPKLHLVQTGDLMDFWIGLKLGFETTKDGYGVKLREGAKEFVDYWRGETLSAEKTVDGKRVGGGKVLRKLLDLKATKGSHLETFILYGNHDNYLCKHGGCDSSYHEGQNVYAEHGHQSDGWNSDEDANMGWALTQAAFLWPWIRDIEDDLSAGVTRVKRKLFGDPGTRLQRIARAADICFEKKKSIYVLGHTHQAQLKKIKLHTATIAKALEYQILRWVESGRPLNDSAVIVGEQIGYELGQEAVRVREWTDRYGAEKVRQLSSGITEVQKELRQLKAATSSLAHETADEAGRKLEEAKRELENLGEITEAAARNKVENARQKLEEAQKDLKIVSAKVAAHGAWQMHQTQQKAAEIARQIEGLERESEAYARKKVAEAHRLLEGELERMKRALEQGHAELTKAQARAEKWASEAIQSAKGKAAEVQKKLEETLSSWKGGGGRSGGRGATGS